MLKLSIVFYFCFLQNFSNEKINLELNFKIEKFISKLSKEELNCYVKLKNGTLFESKGATLCDNLFEKEHILLKQNIMIYNYVKMKLIKPKKKEWLDSYNHSFDFFITMCIIEKYIYHVKFIKIDKIIKIINDKNSLKYGE